MMQTIIIDDDPIFVELLSSFLKTEDVIPIAKFNNPIDAIPFLKKNQIDLIYLDIHMPYMKGTEFLEVINEKLPPVILTTSDTEFGIQAFNYNVISYLVKPFSYSDFKKSFDKAILLKGVKNEIQENIIFVKSSGTIYRLDKTEILYIECIGDYASIHTSKEKFVVHGSMRHLENTFNAPEFLRVHRSFIVRYDKIKHIEDDAIIFTDKIIPLGKTYKQDVYSKFKPI